jgi:hypothetical protein
MTNRKEPPSWLIITANASNASTSIPPSGIKATNGTVPNIKPTRIPKRSGNASATKKPDSKIAPHKNTPDAVGGYLFSSF